MDDDDLITHLSVGNLDDDPPPIKPGSAHVLFWLAVTVAAAWFLLA